jgi:hypothetical protein
MYVSSSHACKDGGVYLDDFLNAAYKHGLAVFLLAERGGWRGGWTGEGDPGRTAKTVLQNITYGDCMSLNV